MIFDGSFSDTHTWTFFEKRVCRFMFIGKNLDRKELEEGLMACKAEECLRFNVGDMVEARAQGGFQPGKVIKVWDGGNPYRIELQNDARTNVWGPMDADICVRAVQN